MATPDLSVGVDEFTLILQSVDIDNMAPDQWPEKVDAILEDFLKKSKIELLFGQLEPATAKIQAGYTDGLTYADQPWYFMIAWHEFYVKMGVCVKFSAFAYAAYKQAFKAAYQTDLNISTFLKMVQSNLYVTRLSRIDLTADYMNYPDPIIPNKQLSPDSIYNRLQDGLYRLQNNKGKSTIKTFSALHKDGAYETFYAGTRKGKTDGFLRCYNKKEEQIQTHGFRYQEAELCESWVRFEAVFKQNYAHQITHQLLHEIGTDAELQQAISKHIVDRYCFWDVADNEAAAFSADLAGIAAGARVNALSRPNARDNSLAQSIAYLRDGSGLYATFYKVYEIWGADGERELLEHLKECYEYNYKLQAPKNRDIQYWLNKHRKALIGTQLSDLFYIIPNREN